MSVLLSMPFAGRARVPLVLQAEAAECGLACVCMVAQYFGHDIDLAAMRRRFGTSRHGVTLARILEVATELGIDGRAVRTDVDGLANLSYPCILHWDLNHFVIATGPTRSGLEVLDPARGRLLISTTDVDRHFTGVAVLLSKKADFQKLSDTRTISLRALTGRISGLKRSIAQLIALAAGIEIIAIALPFQLQLTVDWVLTSHDYQAALVAGGAFLTLAVARGGLMLARASLLSWFGASLNAQWITNTFAHLIRLPLQYFEKRHLGDTVSRFTSLYVIQRTVSGAFVEGLLDGLLSILTLAILFVYQPSMAAISLAFGATYAALRLFLQSSIMRINAEQLVLSARQQTELLESVSGIQAVKLAGAQSQRVGRLADASQRVAKREMQLQYLTLSLGAANSAVFNVQRAALVLVGTYFALNGAFSAGMLVAFLAYTDHFSLKLASLVDKISELRTLKVHLQRVADIVLEPAEPTFSAYSGPAPRPAIRLENVSFRYSSWGPWILRGVSLEIEPGESVCITGPSGAGKSTLAKIVLGLLTPTEGRVLIDGIDIRHLGLDRFRKMSGAVMQTDSLFSGTIADNISFFSADADLEGVMRAAKTAVIHNEILKLPMGYETVLGGGGVALSGGQEQRLLLARALYRHPSLLVLDESTSHLDTVNEHEVNRNIRAMNITRLIIAHRQETVRSADRVIHIDQCPPTDGPAQSQTTVLTEPN